MDTYHLVVGWVFWGRVTVACAPRVTTCVEYWLLSIIIFWETVVSRLENVALVGDSFLFCLLLLWNYRTSWSSSWKLLTKVRIVERNDHIGVWRMRIYWWTVFRISAKGWSLLGCLHLFICALKAPPLQLYWNQRGYLRSWSQTVGLCPESKSSPQSALATNKAARYREFNFGPQFFWRSLR